MCPIASVCVCFSAVSQCRVYFKRGVQPKCGVQNEKCGVQNSIWSVILRKIIKTVATRLSDSKARMHQNPKFGWGSTPDPAGGAYSAPHNP